MLLLLVTACSEQPTFSDAQKNFYSNRSTFAELSKIACQLGQKKQEFSYRKESFRYNSEKISEKHRNLKVDELLAKIEASGVSYEKTVSGKCSLVVGYYAHGFGGSGMSYKYSYQVESVTPFIENEHTLEKIVEGKKALKFDKPLTDGWYFTFNFS